MSIFDKKLRTSLPVIWLETLTEKSGSVRLNEHEHNKLTLILVDPVDDEDLKRSSTNWSLFSKWSWNWLRIFVLKWIDFSLTFVLRLLAFNSVRFSARSINQDSLVRSGLRVQYLIEYRIVSSLVSRLVFTQYEPK
jgi:hypothetical protein